MVDDATALSGFGDPVVVVIAALFVVSEAIDSSGLTAWTGATLTARLGTSRRRLTTGLLVLVALLSAEQAVDLSGYPRTVARHDDLQHGVSRLEVADGSPLSGQTVGEGALAGTVGGFPDLLVVGAQDASGALAPLTRSLAPLDVLVVSGPEEQVAAAASALGLRVRTPATAGLDGAGLLSEEAGVVEVVIPPRSACWSAACSRGWPWVLTLWCSACVTWAVTSARGRPA